VSDRFEEQILIKSDTGMLSGMLYAPGGTALGSALFCNPLFEERKSSQRVMVECARALAADGFMVLRFDYRGCGDSEGNFKDFTASDWIPDIKSAVQLLTERSGSSSFSMLGLRLGANLAVSSILDGLSPQALILWEPIADGTEYIEHELRRKLLREMVTFGKGRATRESISEELKAGKSVDLDGYELSPALFASIKELSLLRDIPSVANPTMLANITHSDEPSPGMLPLRALLSDSTQSFEVIKEQPFWNRIGLVKCPELLQKTQTWIKNYK
jgi:exosortase A-associated hydrolase 2